MRQLLLIIITVCFTYNLMSQGVFIASNDIGAGQISPINISVSDYDDSYTITNIYEGECYNPSQWAIDNYGSLGYILYYTYQRSYDQVNWSNVTDAPDPTVIWEGPPPAEWNKYPPEDKMNYHNLEYTIPQSDFNSPYGTVYYRRVCWEGARSFANLPIDFRASYSQVVTVRFYDLMDGGGISPVQQIITDGRNPLPINNSASANSGIVFSRISYGWEHSEDQVHWDNLTPVPAPGDPSSDEFISYTPGVVKGMNFYRRIAYETNTGNPQPYRAQSNIVSIHNVYITSPGTIVQNPTGCDIRYINFVEGTPIVYSGDGTSACDFIHGYEISYNGGATWESNQVPSDQPFDVSIDFGESFQFRRWVADPFDQIDGVRQYTNTISIDASNSGVIKDASTHLCETNNNPIVLNNVTEGSYNGESISHQWQVSTNNSVFVDIAGETGLSLNYNPSNYNEYLFFRRKMYVTGCSDYYSLYSNTIETHTPRALDGGTVSSTKNTYCHLEDIGPLINTSNNSGRDVVYIWTGKPHDNSSSWVSVRSAGYEYVYSGGANLALSDMDSDIWEFALNHGGADFRRETWEISSDCRSYSNTYTLYTYPEISPGAIGYDETICSSDALNQIPDIQQTSAPSGGRGEGYIYSWEFKDEGDSTWKDIAGKTNNRLDFDSLVTNTRTYRRKVHDGCLAEDMAQFSNEVTYTYKDYSIEGMISDFEDCSGSMATFVAADTFNSYRWNLNKTIYSNGSNIFTRTLEDYDSTLSLIVTDGDGCEAVTEVSINPFSLPNFVMPEVHICEGDSALVTAPEGYNEYAFDGLAIQNSNSIMLTYNQAVLNQNRSISVTDSNGCSSNTIYYAAFPELKPVINLSDASICNGQSKTLSVPASNVYKNIIWMGESGVISEGNTNFSITVSPTETTTYTVIVENSYCTSQAQMTLTVFENPVLALRDTFACKDDYITITADDDYINHYWSTNHGFDNRTTTFRVTDTFTLALRVIDENSCETTSSITVTMKPLPVLLIDPITACEKDSVTLSAGDGFSKYLWQNGETTPEIKVIVNPLTGNNRYSVRASDEFGCSTESIAEVKPNPLPQNFGIGTQITCEGEDHLIEGIPGFDSYYYSTGEPTQNITVNFENDTALYIKVSNEFGCYDSTFFNIHVEPIPFFEIKDTSKCNDGLLFETKSPITANKYYWSNGSINKSTQYNLTTTTDIWLEVENGYCSHTDTFRVELLEIPFVQLTDTSICFRDTLIYTAGGDYKEYIWNNGQKGKTLVSQVLTNADFTLRVIDDNGCENLGTMRVEKLNLPIVNITSPTRACYGNSIELSVQSGFESTLWSTLEETTTINAVILNDTTFGVNVIDHNGCKAGTEKTITVNQLPIGNLKDTTICKGDFVILKGNGSYNLNWSTGATGNNILFKPDSPVMVYLTMTDYNGCIGYDSTFINVRGLPHVTIPSPTVCLGDSVFIESPQVFDYQYWSNGDIGPSTWHNAVNSQDGLTFIYQDDIGCQGETNININTITPAQFNIYPQTICQGETAHISSIIGLKSYWWSTGANTYSINVSPDTTSYYTLHYEDKNGCKATKETYVAVNELPEVDIEDEYLCPGTSKILSGASGNYVYKWSNNSTSKYFNISYNSPGDYFLQLTDRETNCSNIGYFSVFQLPLPIVGAKDTSACKGQSILVELTDEYNYIWDDGSTGNIKEFIAGSSKEVTFSIIDTNSCLTQNSFYFKVFNAPILDIDDQVLCNESNVSLSVPYAEGFNYSWHNGNTSTSIVQQVDSVVNGWVKAENAFCFVTDSFRLVSEILPGLNLEDIVFCKGATKTVELPIGYIYEWSTGDTTASIVISEENRGGIFVTISTENGCEVMDGFKAIKETITVDFTIDSTELFKGSSTGLYASANTEGNIMYFDWEVGGKTFSGSEISYTAMEKGLFDVFLLAETFNGCKDSVYFEEYILVKEKGGSGGSGGGGSGGSGDTPVSEVSKIMNIGIYPNPVKDVLYIDTRSYENNNEISIKIYDIAGKTILFDEIDPMSVNHIDMSSFESSVYFLKVTINGIESLTKIIKAK